MRNFFSILFGIIVIVFGVVLILENFNVIEFSGKDLWLYAYPTFFVIYGGKLTIDYMRRKGGSWVAGSFLLLFGALLLLGRFDVIEFAFRDLYKLWPMLIVYIGFGFLGSFRRKKRIVYTHHWDVGADKGKKQKANQDQKSNFFEDADSHEQTYDRRKDTKYRDRTSFFSVGDFNYSEENWHARPMHLKSMAGDFHFDFTKAFIPEEHIPIRINGLAGDVHILVPKNIPFRVDASVKAGEIVIDGQETSGVQRSVAYEIDGFEEAERRLDFYIRLSAGAIRIDRV